MSYMLMNTSNPRFVTGNIWQTIENYNISKISTSIQIITPFMELFYLLLRLCCYTLKYYFVQFNICL